MNTPEVIQRSIILTTKHTGMRFDQVAAELFDEFSRSRLQEWIKQGCLTLDAIASSPSSSLEDDLNKRDFSFLKNDMVGPYLPDIT